MQLIFLGSFPSNFTSTTAPITCVTFPLLLIIYKLSAPDIISINSFVMARLSTSIIINS